MRVLETKVPDSRQNCLLQATTLRSTTQVRLSAEAMQVLERQQLVMVSAWSEHESVER